ncbi:MAG TPA: RNA polymerase sigma factor [Flavisolibacter sp.]|nr:RNA polymerase sigma factor [Flavisolibacter sp.]
MKSLPAIIAGCKQNNLREQKVLYETYYGYCLKIVFRYIYHYEKAVDIVNDGFIKVFKNLTHFKEVENDSLQPQLMGWMRMIMVNTAIDFLRKNNFLPEIGNVSEEVWEQEDKSQSSDQVILYKELIQQIKTLSPGYRTVFNMYVIDGFTHKEIASQLGITVGTSKSNLFKARMYLQKVLKKNDLDVALCSI